MLTFETWAECQHSMVDKAVDNGKKLEVFVSAEDDQF